MSSLLDVAAGPHSTDVGVRPRSVISGRQRWDVKPVLGRPQAADVLAAVLRRVPGITEAQASPVTGGLLVRHDARVRGADVGRLVRRAVALVMAGSAGARRPAPARPAAGPEPRTDRGVVGPVLAVGGGVVAGLALIRGASLGKQLVALGGVAVATGIVVRKAWRRTVDASRDLPGNGAGRHPLLEIVGPHRRRLWRADRPQGMRRDEAGRDSAA